MGWELVSDSTLEYFYSRSAKPNVFEASIRVAVEAYREFTAFGGDFDVVIAYLVMIAGEGAGRDACSAGEGFVFHAAFIGTDDDFVRAFLFYKVDVDALFGEV